MRHSFVALKSTKQKHLSVLLAVFMLSATYSPVFAQAGAPVCPQGSVAIIGAGNNTLSCTPLVKVDSRGWVGFGVDPLYNLDVLQSPGLAFEPTGGTGLAVRSYSEDVAARSTLLRARGSVSQPKAVKSGDSLGNFRTDAFDGQEFVVAGRVRMIAAEDWTPTQHAAYLAFGTTPENGKVPVDYVFILPNGQVGIGTTEPQATLDVAGSLNATQVSVGGHALTPPPVCIGRNFLQYDGKNWHCTPWP